MWVMGFRTCRTCATNVGSKGSAAQAMLRFTDSALALLNIALLHRGVAWNNALGRNQPDRRVRLACGVSLLCWLAALVLGRLVGYR